MAAHEWASIFRTLRSKASAWSRTVAFLGCVHEGLSGPNLSTLPGLFSRILTNKVPGSGRTFPQQIPLASQRVCGEVGTEQCKSGIPFPPEDPARWKIKAYSRSPEA